MTAGVSEVSPVELGLPGVHVRTVTALRWIAVGGQSLTLGVVATYFDYTIPWLPVGLALLASVLMNLMLTFGYRSSAHMTGPQAALQFAFDLTQLSVLLFLTGGVANPFSVLILVPVTISATLLSLRSTIALSGFAALSLVVLWRWSLPLPWSGAQPLPEIYRFGVWTALMLAMMFLTAYAWLVTAQARLRQKALVATQTALAREQKLAALGSLAAAAAHELGGPLGTITLIAKDLKDQLGNDPDFGADLTLLNEEATRCRNILVTIAQRAEADEVFQHLPLEAIMREVVRPFEARGATIRLTRAGPQGVQPVWTARRPELLHGLSNFVANAVRHTTTAVEIDIRESRDTVWMSITDDGPGFSSALLPKLGEPDLGPHLSEAGGTGLGIFIAVTLLERTGARLRFSNWEQGGASVEVSWRRAQVDVGRKGSISANASVPTQV